TPVAAMALLRRNRRLAGEAGGCCGMNGSWMMSIWPRPQGAQRSTGSAGVVGGLGGATSSSSSESPLPQAASEVHNSATAARRYRVDRFMVGVSLVGDNGAPGAPHGDPRRRQ